MGKKKQLDRPPLQARSRKTLEGISSAISELLAEREYEDISIADITTRAGVTAGAFYTRFPSKEAALDYLVLNMLQTQLEGARAFFAEERWADHDLKARVEVLIDMTVETLKKKSGLVRALAIRETVRPHEINREEKQLRAAASKTIETWLLSRRDEINDASPEKTVAFFLTIVRSVVNAQIIFPTSKMSFSPNFIAQELKRAAVAYLLCKNKTL